MALLELPHSADCLVCGRANPRGLKLSLHVDPESGGVSCAFAPDQTVCGFADIVHGGMLATVFDEAMVWAAAWAGRRFCLCAELTTRFLAPAKIGGAYDVRAQVEKLRPRLINVAATMQDDLGKTIATAQAKYIPLPPPEHRRMLATMLRETPTAEALRRLTEE